MTQQIAPHESVARYGVAMAALAGAILLRWLLDPLLGDLMPFTIVFGAVAIAIWVAGYRCALLVAALGYVASSYLFIAPRGVLSFDEPRDLLRLGAYLLISLMLIGFGEATRRARERHRAGEAAARQRAETLSFILANVGDAVITTDVLGNVSSLNPVAESLTGWTRSEATGQPLTQVFRIVHEETRQPIDNPASRVLREHRASGVTNHTLLISRQGRELPIDDSAVPILDGAGATTGAVLIFHEISERREAERRQQQGRAETQRLLELNQAIVTNMAEGLYTVDTQGLVTFMNPAAERLLGWSSAELLGRKMHEATHYKHADGSPFPIEECAGFQVLHDGKTLVDYEDTFIRKDGSFLPVAYCASPLPSAAETAGLVVVFRDTTQQKWAEQQLRELAAGLEEADRRKDEFLAMLAHELRNPLAPIRNGLQIIRLAGGNPAMVEQARVIMERQLAQLIHLVDDLLDVSRISLGKLVLRKERLELLAVLNDALETSRPLIEGAGHRITLDLSEKSLHLDADRTRLVQVFANILNNAARYSARGGRIGISARRDGSDVLVEVSDSGYGIPEERLPQIFEMFSHIDPSPDHPQDGLGIGLALVKHLVVLHGGSVAAHSDGAGQGSEFVVRLPAAPAAGAMN